MSGGAGAGDVLSTLFCAANAKPVAVDAMGGDFAPQVVVEGAIAAAHAHCPVMLFGPSKRLDELLAAVDPSWQKLPITLFDASDSIGMGDSPVDAVRRGECSSMVLGIKAVAAGECAAFMSAGNSGAVVVASTLVLGRQEGVIRPAIGAEIPSKKGSVFMLDLGANVDCRPEHLVQFATLGISEVKRVKAVPTVGLLCNGEEPGKGSALVKAAYPLLQVALGSMFIGNVEPRDLIEGNVDVVVTDGFTGNLVLKTIEAMILPASYADTVTCGNDWHRHVPKWYVTGGARLLGVRGAVIIAHGRASADDVLTAILYAQACGKRV